MALTPLGVQLSTKYTLTGPDGTIATFNDPTDANFVGYITELTGLDSSEVRENAELIAGADGAVHGEFWYGRRPITLAGEIPNVVSSEDRNKKLTKLMQSSNAMRLDAKLNWTPDGGIPVEVRVRRQQALRVTGGWVKSFQLLVVSSDPRIYSVEEPEATAELVTSASIATGTQPQGIASSPDFKFVYVANNGANTISVFERNTETGKLTAKETKACGTKPTNLAVSPDGENLYVTNSTANTISVFNRSKVTGALTAQAEATKATGTTPVDLIVTGTHVLVINEGTTNISVYTRTTTTTVLKETVTIGAPTTSTKPVGIAYAPNAIIATGISGHTTYRVTVIFGGIGSGSAYHFESKTWDATAGKFLTGAEYATAGSPEAGANVSGTFSGKPTGISIVNPNALGTITEIVVTGVAVEGQGRQYTYGEEGNESLGLVTFASPVGTRTSGAGTRQEPAFISASGRNSAATMPSANIITEIHPFSSGQISAGKEPWGIVFVNGTVKSVYATNRIDATVSEYDVVEAESSTYLVHKYGASAAVTNKGSAETSPALEFEVVGSNFETANIVNETTKQLLAFTTVLAAGSKVTINFANRTVTVNGANAFSFVNTTSTEWWQLAPGVNNITISGGLEAGGKVKMKIKWRHAWI